VSRTEYCSHLVQQSLSVEYGDVELALAAYMKRMIIALTLLLAASCSSPTAPDTINTTGMTWVIQNACSGTVNVKFFDRTNGGAWPNSSQVYLLDAGDERTFKIECREGAQVCFGATLRSNQSYYWGVSTSNDQGCEGCCSACGRGDPTPRSLQCR